MAEDEHSKAQIREFALIGPLCRALVSSLKRCRQAPSCYQLISSSLATCTAGLKEELQESMHYCGKTWTWERITTLFADWEAHIVIDPDQMYLHEWNRYELYRRLKQVLKAMDDAGSEK